MFEKINFCIYLFNKLIKKSEKKFNISLYYFFPLRIIHLLIEKVLLDKILSKNYFNISDYFLKKINFKSLIIISAGIGTDASFEATMI